MPKTTVTEEDLPSESDNTKFVIIVIAIVTVTIMVLGTILVLLKTPLTQMLGT